MGLANTVSLNSLSQCLYRYEVEGRTPFCLHFPWSEFNESFTPPVGNSGPGPTWLIGFEGFVTAASIGELMFTTDMEFEPTPVERAKSRPV